MRCCSVCRWHNCLDLVEDLKKPHFSFFERGCITHSYGLQNQYVSTDVLVWLEVGWKIVPFRHEKVYIWICIPTTANPDYQEMYCLILFLLKKLNIEINHLDDYRNVLLFRLDKWNKRSQINEKDWPLTHSASKQRVSSKYTTNTYGDFPVLLVWMLCSLSCSWLTIAAKKGTYFQVLHGLVHQFSRLTIFPSFPFLQATRNFSITITLIYFTFPQSNFFLK